MMQRQFSMIEWIYQIENSPLKKSAHMGIKSRF